MLASHGERVAPRSPASPSQPLVIAAPPGAQLFAPSAEAPPNGWAPSYSVGPLEPSRRGRDPQRGWLASHDGQLAVHGSAVQISDSDVGSDGMIVFFGERVQVVYMGDQGQRASGSGIGGDVSVTRRVDRAR